LQPFNFRAAHAMPDLSDTRLYALSSLIARCARFGDRGHRARRPGTPETSASRRWGRLARNGPSGLACGSRSWRCPRSKSRPSSVISSGSAIGLGDRC